MKILPVKASAKSYLSDFKGFTARIVFTVLGFVLAVFCVSEAEAQTRKQDKIASQGKLSTKPLDKETKAKKFEELSDFVIVDYRANAVADIVDDPDASSSLKRDMEEMFPLHTVFATSDPNVCVVGVQSSADAKTVFSKTNPKKSRIAKRNNIGKMLAEKNVKLITKEK